MPKAKSQFKSIAHVAYLTTIGIKGFDGAVELVVGLLIWLAGSERFYLFVLNLTAPEFDDQPDGPMMQAVRHGASSLINVEVGFLVFYLLVHGALKLGVAVSLLRGGGRWVFPLASIILAGFVAYMGWHLSQHWSNWLLGFALFDFLTLALVLNEWRAGDKA